MLPPVLYVRVEENGQIFRCYSFAKHEISVGRVVGHDVELPAEEVSRWHARILWAGEQLTITDADSRNGTFVNGGRIHGSVKSHYLDLTVRIWLYTLTFKISSGETRPAPLGSRDPRSLDEPITAPHRVPDRAYLRCLLTHMFPVEADLRSFLIDSFFDIAERCPGQVDVEVMRNLLLQIHAPETVLAALRRYKRERYLAATRSCSGPILT